MTTDPIADMLTRIRNANMVRQDFVLIPWSKMKMSMAKILKEEGFIQDYEILKGKPGRTMKLHLKYVDRSRPAILGLKRVSRPGLRVYVGASEIPRVYGGLGIAMLSTSKGLMTEEIPFLVGQAVAITDGPFTDFNGTVEDVMPDKGKVRVSVSLFWRPTSVELDYLQLKGH